MVVGDFFTRGIMNGDALPGPLPADSKFSYVTSFYGLIPQSILNTRTEYADTATCKIMWDP